MNSGIAEQKDLPADRRAGAIAASSRGLEGAQWRQLLLITAAAVGLYVTLRLLPTGTNLSHMDFRAQGKNSIEFCDPLNPQFIPVVAARSPVTMVVTPAKSAAPGSEVQAVLALHTSTGKPVAPEDLLVVHTQPLHLMVVDPTLTDYQHVHPQPTGTAGDWKFAFTPHRSGAYRLFADFTPVATARGLYASTDFVVGGPASAPPETARPPGVRVVVRDGYRYELVPSATPVRAGQPVDYRFRIAAVDGGEVPMAPVMGAYAHLVAFDEGRTGFAHLHPAQADPLQPPNAIHPELAFKLTIPSRGRYVIWSQVNIAGQERFVPFWFDVE